MNLPLRAFAAIFLGALAVAAKGEAPAPGIVVTINPEGRVSVAAKGVLPEFTVIGVPTVLPISIINQGFATGHLEAVLGGNVPEGASIEMAGQALKGTPKETRDLRLTLSEAGTVDLTLVFRLRHEVPDLGGIDRIHMVIECVRPEAQRRSSG